MEKLILIDTISNLLTTIITLAWTVACIWLGIYIGRNVKIKRIKHIDHNFIRGIRNNKKGR